MKTLFLSLLLVASFASEAAKKNLDLEALRVEYDNFVTDKKLKQYARTEKADAKATIEKIYNSRKGRVKAHAVYMARHKLAFAKLVAEAQFLEEQLSQASDQYDDLQINLFKTEAVVARFDADKTRLLLNLRAEEAERALASEKSALALASEKDQQIIKTRAELNATKKYAEAQAVEAGLAREEADLAFEEINALRRQLDSIASRKTSQGLVMTIGDFVFDSASATIKQAAVENFDKVLEFLDTHPGRDIRIEGHTDSSGSAQFNLNLSQNRADAVKALLVDFGVPSGRITAEGLGEEFPVADNTSNTGKAKNRRVDIILLN